MKIKPGIICHFFFLFAIGFPLVDVTAGHGVDGNSFKGWIYFAGIRVYF